MLLCRHTAASHAQPAAARRSPRVPIATVACRTGSLGVRVGVLRRAGRVRTPAQQLVSILIMRDGVAGGFYRIELRPVVGELRLESPKATTGLLLLCGVEFLVCQRTILVECPREGCQARGEGS